MPSRPHLTFFVELESGPLAALLERPEVLPFLVEQRCTVSMGLLDLDATRAAQVRRLEEAGVPVTAWLLLDVEDGYWLNADNPERARARWLETAAWARREGLRLHRVGLDVEPPRAEAEALARGGLRALARAVGRRRPPAAVERSEAAYARLVAEIRATGRSVETYHVPLLLDERAARSGLLRRTLALVDVSADVEVHMLYASYLSRAGARSYFAEAPAIALGVTGGGVNAGEDAARGRLLSCEVLEEDLRAAAAHSREVYVFSLEGCVERGMLDGLSRIRWDDPVGALGAVPRTAAWLARAALRGALRGELLLDRALPAG